MLGKCMLRWSPASDSLADISIVVLISIPVVLSLQKTLCESCVAILKDLIFQPHII